MHLLILILWVVLVGSYINGPVGDPDLWWHITVGRWILANKQLPSIDLWNAYSDGSPWRAYSWLHEIAYASIEAHWGVLGLWIAQLCLAIAMVAVFVAVFSSLSKDKFVGAILGTIVAVACFQNFSLRPQAFVWLLFALMLGLAQSIILKGASPRRLALLLVIFVLWANSHITAIIGLGSLFLWVLAKDRVRLAVGLVSVGFFGTFLTPYFGGEWVTFLSSSGHPLSMTSIAEFQSATIMRYGAAILIMLCAIVIAGFSKFPSLFPPARLVLILGLVCAGAAVVKFIPFAAVVLGALLSVGWSELSQADKGAGKDGLFEGIERLRGALNWLPTNGVSFLLFSLAVVLINNSSQTPLNTTLIPKSALDYIIKHDLPTPLLNDFGRGGYVMYRMSDSNGNLASNRRVPLDGRTNVNAPDLWAAYRKAVEGRSGWRGLLERTHPETILWRRESPLVELLKTSGEWKEVFSSGNADSGFVVLSKAR